MKRIREILFAAFSMLVVFSFFAEYPATASAPGLRSEVAGVAEPPAEPAGWGAAPYIVQRFVERSADRLGSAVARSLEGESTVVAKKDADEPAVADSAETAPAPTPFPSNDPPVTSLPPQQASAGSFCDPNFVGPPIVFNTAFELSLGDLLDQLHNRFGVNFLLGPGIERLPVNVKTGAIPWNVLLKSQLFVSGVRARCINANTIELVGNSELPKLQDTADVSTRFVKLKFLQRTAGGTVDLAGRSSGGQNGGGGGGSCGAGGSGSAGGTNGGGYGGGGGGNAFNGETAAQLQGSRFDKLIIEIEKILGIRSMTESTVGSGSSYGQGGGGGTGSQVEERRTNRFVTQIPGRNILVIRATEEEHNLINEIIKRADRAPFQVVVKGLVYTANQQRLFDLGVQTNVSGGNAAGDIFGDFTGHTASTARNNSFFNFSAMVGTFNFSVQANAFEQNGVISIKSRPFTTVLDGLCTTLDVGPSLPIVVDSTLGGQGSVTFVNAANNLSVTPYVVDDEAGNPIAVTLDVRITANDVDNSTVVQGIPAISQRSIQTQLLLGPDKTAILGGFTIDQDRKTVSKTPGLGDLPVFGQLFKRRIRDSQLNRLYFALSVAVIPFGQAIEPVEVPGATTQPPSLTPRMLDRSNKAEPRQVVPPKTDH